MRSRRGLAPCAALVASLAARAAGAEPPGGPPSGATSAAGGAPGVASSAAASAGVASAAAPVPAGAASASAAPSGAGAAGGASAGRGAGASAAVTLPATGARLEAAGGGLGREGLGLEARGAARVGWVTSAGFDPFSENDVFAQVSFGASYAVVRSGPLALLAGVFYEGGRAAASARGADASLALHRVGVGAEARYAWRPWLWPYARLAPGALRLDAKVDDPGGGRALEVGRWSWSVDATAGLVVPLGPPGRGGAPFRGALLFAEGGYGVAGAVSMAAAPEGGGGALARPGAVALPPLRPAGALVRAGAGLAF